MMDFDVDIDALLDEEEEIMGELQSEVVNAPSRKRAPDQDTNLMPPKQRKSIADSNVPVYEETYRDLLEADKENEIQTMQTALPTQLTVSEIENDGQLIINEDTEHVPLLESSVVMTERPDIATDYMTICSEDGLRFYLNIRSELEIEDEEQDLGTNTRKKFVSLTDEAFDSLIEKAKLERKRWECLPTETAVEETAESNTPTDLWVDKYSPRGYTDLLSEEYVNRTLLTWLKSWDHSVFGSARKHKPRPTTTPPIPGQPVVNLELDPTGRPQQKVVLLCGPPGLGKTTLAYIAARHCGYSVVEVNASDDRSPELFRQRIESGSSTRYSVAGDQRPICLIMDEVDGAPQPAIDVLVNACKSAQSGKKKVLTIQRPVICICNDLYAPALRQLRPHAFVISFPTPQVARLAIRLLEIVQREAMRADMGTLSSLAERSERDIRSCLNTLQFLRGRGHSEITQNLLSTLNLGHKDVQKGLFFVWSKIFTMPRPQSSGFAARASPTVNPLARRSGDILRACGRSAGGDWQRLVDGLHENFLEMRVKDNKMHKISGAFEWLRFDDIMSKIVSKSQDYSLLRYQSYLAVYFHLNFANSHPGRLQWPQSSFANHQAITRTRNIIESLIAGTAPGSRYSQRTLIIEVLPILVDVLQPNLRPVNTQLYSERERVDLMSLVCNMLQFGLDLRQERNVEGQYDFVLEPDIAQVARFTSVRQTKGLSYAAKQLIARELSMERMRRMDAGHGPNTEKAESKKKTISSPSVRQPTAWSINEQVKQVKSKRNDVSRDFFGRIVGASNKKAVEKPTDDKEVEKSPLNEKIWFKFKEGYSNAIRRPVRIKDLL